MAKYDFETVEYDLNGILRHEGIDYLKTKCTYYTTLELTRIADSLENIYNLLKDMSSNEVD